MGDRALRAGVSSALCLALALLAAGCGDGDATQPPSVQTVTETTVKESGDTVTVERSDGSKPADGAVTRRSGLQQFGSPTGNIGCALDEGYARCDIRERAWEPSPRPSDCDLDWGSALEVSDQGAGFLCHGDTTLPSDGTQVLGYGDALQVGGFRCSSEKDGMTCQNVDTGSGFFLARESYRIF
jgi:uncharacterized protein DUF6636